MASGFRPPPREAGVDSRLAR